MYDWRKLAQERKDRIDELEEEVRQLRAILRPTVAFPDDWRLTGAQARMLGLLYLREHVSRDALATAGSPDPNDFPMSNVVNTQVSYMRKKLKRFEIRIGTSWGKGYYLTDRSREIVKAALSAASTIET